MLVNKTLKYACEIFWREFDAKAPRDKGNLYYAMGSKPILVGNKVAIINIGSNWSALTKQKYRRDFNYGNLLNDKRVIKNRESADKKKKLQNRRINSLDNTRNIVVKDLKYGKNLRMSRKQLESNNIRLRKENKPRQYELLFIDKNIPIKKSTTPYRVNRHYHYIDNIFDEYCKTLANALGGKLHRGDYIPKERKKIIK